MLGQVRIYRASPLPVYSLNANTVTRVYRDLQQEGLLRLERGLGTFVAPQQRETTLADRDYQRIVKRTRELVALSRESGLTARELAQLVEGIWKEVDREG